MSTAILAGSPPVDIDRALRAMDCSGSFFAAALVRGVKLARRILRAPALAEVIESELLPGADDDLSDAQIEAHARSHAKTVYHPAGTCRMGSEADAVVDTRLRVRGVDKLRVCDASAMPTLPSGNSNAPTIMIAERCAEFLLQAS